jgi:hypothetical protein
MAKKEQPYVSKQSKLQPPAVIHEHRPGATVEQAIANASDHVKRVNAAARRK